MGTPGQPEADIPPPPDIPMRVGLYITSAARDYSVNRYGGQYDIGLRVAAEVESNFRRSFRSVIPLYRVPPTGRDAEAMDLYIVVEEPVPPDQSGNGGGGYNVKVIVPFSVHEVDGDRIDRITGEGETLFQVNVWGATSAMNSANQCVKFSSRKAVREFLHKFSARHAARATPAPTPKEEPAPKPKAPPPKSQPPPAPALPEPDLTPPSAGNP